MGEVMSLRWRSFISVSIKKVRISFICLHHRLLGKFNVYTVYVVPMDTLIYSKFKMNSCEALNQL